MSEQLAMESASVARYQRRRAVDRFDGQRRRPPATSFVMSGEERQLLDRLALEHGISIAEVLRRGLRLYAAHAADEDADQEVTAA